MWIYNDFSTSINITQIRLYTMYFDSTGGATALLSNYAAAVSDTAQESWRSLSSMSTYSLMFYTSTAYAIARMHARNAEEWCERWDLTVDVDSLSLLMRCRRTPLVLELPLWLPIGWSLTCQPHYVFTSSRCRDVCPGVCPVVCAVRPIFLSLRKNTERISMKFAGDNHSINRWNGYTFGRNWNRNNSTQLQFIWRREQDTTENSNQRQPMSN